MSKTTVQMKSETKRLIDELGIQMQREGVKAQTFDEILRELIHGRKRRQ